MVGLVIVAYGEFGREALRTAEALVGRMKQVSTVAIMPHERAVAGRQKVSLSIEEVDSGDGVLLLTDMLGGTASSLALSFHQEGSVEVITGFNLPMLVELRQLRQAGHSLSDIAMKLKLCGLHNISLATEMLQARLPVVSRRKRTVH